MHRLRPEAQSKLRPRTKYRKGREYLKFAQPKAGRDLPEFYKDPLLQMPTCYVPEVPLSHRVQKSMGIPHSMRTKPTSPALFLLNHSQQLQQQMAPTASMSQSN